jgi:DNA-binding NtrC family response regulator
MAHILIVDDEPGVRAALSALLDHHGHTVDIAGTGEAGVAAYVQRRPDVVVLDLTLPDIGGVEVLARIRRHDPRATAIFLTAFGSIRSAVEAMRVGGYDFLTKPFDNDELILALNRALGYQQLSQRVQRLEEDLETRTTFPSIVGRSPAIQEALRRLAKVARLDTTVLLLGESGTGKELAATGLHHQSGRAHQPFVAINCGAIPATLAESELFGHERGAFTDAREARAGRFEQANGGTIFLDEVGELPLETQAKLLRVLQEREVCRVGGKRPISVDVRVVAATNRHLEIEVRDGRFRSDLFWRLNVFDVRLPPLRERREDLPLLINHILDRLNAKLGLRIAGLSPAARARLIAHDWPGNIRELENVLQRAMILTDHAVIDDSDLASHIGSLPSSAPAEDDAEPGPNGSMDQIIARTTDRIERALIENTMAQCRGNRSRAAAALGISRRTLFNKLKKFELVHAAADEE